MPANEATGVQIRLEQLALELEVIEQQVGRDDLPARDARDMLPQIERIREAYGALLGQFAELGKSEEKEERLSVTRRLAAAQSRALQFCPGAAGAPSGSSDSAVVHAKLSPINLPTFSGETEDLLKWYRAFSTTIDSRDDLTSEAKLQYLINSVSGEALYLVNQVESTGASYVTAMKRLRERYEDRATILKHYMERLVSPGRATEDGPVLRRLLDNVRGACHSLMARGYTRAEILDAVCAQLMLDNLPATLKHTWEMRESDDVSYAMLCKFIEKHAHRLSSAVKRAAADVAAQVAATTPSTPMLTWRQCDNLPKDQRQVSSSDHRGRCVGCNLSTNHFLYQCLQFSKMEVSQHSRLVRDSGRCINCLASSHCEAQCRSRRCQVCGGGITLCCAHFDEKHLLTACLPLRLLPVMEVLTSLPPRVHHCRVLRIRIRVTLLFLMAP